MHRRKRYGALLAAILIGSVAVAGILPLLQSPAPPVILIGLESTRADHIGPCYGYSRTTAPNICSIAQDGILFERAYAQGTWTPVSVPTVLTARTPREVGVRWGTNQSLADNLTTLAEVMDRNGYRTTTADTDTFRFEDANLLQGFRYRTTRDTIPTSNQTNTFVFAYFGHPHVPYVAPDRSRRWDNLSMDTGALKAQLHAPSGANRWRQFVNTTPTRTVIDLYDGEIRDMDVAVGRVLERLRAHDRYREALIIVFGDHGEGFGEHERLADHGGQPYQEVIRVPLIVKLPGNEHAGLRVDETVRLVDIPHTVLDVMGIDASFGTVGASLLPLINAQNGISNVRGGDGEDRLVFSAEIAVGDWMVQRDNMTYVLQYPRIVCLKNGEPRGDLLYNLTADPGQQDNIVADHPDIAQSLRTELCRVFTLQPRNASHFRSPLRYPQNTETAYWPYNR